MLLSIKGYQKFRLYLKKWKRQTKIIKIFKVWIGEHGRELYFVMIKKIAKTKKIKIRINTAMKTKTVTIKMRMKIMITYHNLVKKKMMTI